MVYGTWNMPRYRVDWFHLAAISLRRPCVEQQPCRISDNFLYLAGIDNPTGPNGSDELATLMCFDAVLNGTAFREPFGEATVEYRDGVVAQPSQQPPETTCIHASVLIVDDDLRTSSNPKPSERV